jgi:signal transduction histidine kinase
MKLATFIRQHKEKVLQQWSLRVQEELGLNADDQPQLIDHLPEIIDELCTHLEQPTGNWRPLLHSSRLHGQHRQRAGIDIGGLVREFGIVADVIQSLASMEGIAPSWPEQQLLSRLIVHAAADSAEAYARIRDREMAEQAANHFAFIAHEIRNPLQTASMTWQILSRTLSADDPAVQRLHRSLRQLRDIVDNALVDARLMGTVHPRVSRLDAAALVREAIADMELDAEKKSVSIHVEIEASLDFDGDERLLHSIMTNLLGNALKFTRERSNITVRACTAEGGRIRVEVEDECGGLQTDEPGQLFTPFVQINGDRRGFGLGLGIVKQAAEAHQGCVRISNLPGKGCIFIVELPRFQHPAEED